MLPILKIETRRESAETGQEAVSIVWGRDTGALGWDGGRRVETSRQVQDLFCRYSKIHRICWRSRLWEMREREDKDESQVSVKQLDGWKNLYFPVDYLRQCCMGSWAWLPGLEFNVFYFLTLWPWVNYVTALCLGALNCKMGMITWPTSQGCCKDQMS